VLVPGVSAGPANLETGGLTTHRLFIEYDREPTEIIKLYQVLI
jgi:hypothetical protein